MIGLKGMKGSLLILALLGSGMAGAQAFQPQQNQSRNRATPAPPDDEGTVSEEQADQRRSDDDFSDVVAADQQAEQQAPGDPRDAAADTDREDAITHCALAARDEAERDGGYAEVRQVQEPRGTRDGYDVEGEVEVRSGWRMQDGVTRAFACSVRNGRISDVWFPQDRSRR